ncbi:MAG: hypothetical protein HY370_08130 [Proteobacteria bacterium]|nr:hypothetical protein [Pseudomonadota bacterium]
MPQKKDSDKVMVTLTGVEKDNGSAPDIPHIAKLFNVAVTEFDPVFGVIEQRDWTSVGYCVKTNRKTADAMWKARPGNITGIWPDLPITPM